MKFLKDILKDIFLGTLCAFSCHVASAQALIQKETLPSTFIGLNAATNQALTASSIAIRGGSRDITIWLVANTATATGPSNTIAWFNISPDNTNYTTTYPFSLSVTLNGNTNVCASATFYRTNFSGTYYLRCDKMGSAQIAPTTNSIFVTFDP